MNILPEDKLNRCSFMMWFMLATVALAFSGIYAILPILLRTPILAELFPLKNFFKISLIVHVNLAVLMWFLSSTAMLMSSVTRKAFAPAGIAACYASMIGSVFVMASPFVGVSEPILNNYIPILHNFAFIVGISLFFSGIILQVFLTLLSFSQIKGDIIRLISFMSAVIFVVAVFCFAESCLALKILSMKRFIDLEEYYELLFWGAGHVLQFNYVQLILVVWLVIIGKDKYDAKQKFLFRTQYINLMLVLLVVPIYSIYSIDSPELYEFFTLHMRYAGGIIMSVIALWTGYKLLRSNYSAIGYTSYACSAILILSGGIIGYLISGMNVTIPAHYHGVIIGITVGLMGLFYLLLPEMGFAKIAAKKAVLQMVIYTSGQLIHIAGLALSGGYGALRKSPEGYLSAKAKIYMGVMGMGGGIALIGGIMFVVLVFLSIKNKEI